MPLVKASLSSQLEQVFTQKPSVAAEAASGWAQAYLSYASAALSPTGGMPVTAPAGLSILMGAFTGAFSSQDSSGAASSIASGVMGFWSSLVWVGAAAVGSTLSPGNSSLSSALSGIFSDTGEKSEGDKARAIADAFDAGAKEVMVNDILTSTGVPSPGPIQ